MSKSLGSNRVSVVLKQKAEGLYVSGNGNFPLFSCSCLALPGRMWLCEKGVSGCAQREGVIGKEVTEGTKYVNPVHCLTR